MSYQVLARKWRPKSFDQIVGQGHITKSLQNAILRQKLGHAYILAGTRGIGKTSIARIFAKAVRCQELLPNGNPCQLCTACIDSESGNSMDVLEIDGASNNSVDNIRQLVENVQLLPALGRYKIYIIDEVHMLSNSAFNALLKTLEEPPEHVIFIFATTDPNKLLGTVLSRCQRLDFRNASIDDLITHLKVIAQEEQINFESDELIKKLATFGRGSVRDTLSLLDQVLSYTEDNEITEAVLVRALGIAKTSQAKELVTSILTGNISQLSSIYAQLLQENVTIKNIVLTVSDRLYLLIQHFKQTQEIERLKLVDPEAMNDIGQAELFWIYETIAKDLSWAENSFNPEKVVEVLLQKVTLRRTLFTPAILESKKKDYKVDKAASKRAINNPAPAPAKPKDQNPPSPMPPPAPPVTDRSWEDFLAFLVVQSPAAAANLEQGNILSPVKIDENQVHIELGFGTAEQVFFEYLQEKEVKDRLKGYLSSFYNIPATQIKLNLQLVDQQQKARTNFHSRAEVSKQRTKQRQDEQIDQLRSDPLIGFAEKLFNSKIDKIIIKE
jgi:DNA polymerase III subunit gamma/tau